MWEEKTCYARKTLRVIWERAQTWSELNWTELNHSGQPCSVKYCTVLYKSLQTTLHYTSLQQQVLYEYKADAVVFRLTRLKQTGRESVAAEQAAGARLQSTKPSTQQT